MKGNVEEFVVGVTANVGEVVRTSDKEMSNIASQEEVDTFNNIVWDRQGDDERKITRAIRYGKIHNG